MTAPNTRPMRRMWDFAFWVAEPASRVGIVGGSVMRVVREGEETMVASLASGSGSEEGATVVVVLELRLEMGAEGVLTDVIVGGGAAVVIGGYNVERGKGGWMWRCPKSNSCLVDKNHKTNGD